MFRVQYGFDKMSYLRVEAGTELEKAIYAWIEQVPVAIGDKMIQGKHIISIEPDFRYYTGWYDTYNPTTGEDFAQIERDCPKLDGYIEAYKDRVLQLISSNQTDLIGKGSFIQIEQKEEPKKLSGLKSMKQLLESH